MKIILIPMTVSLTTNLQEVFSFQGWGSILLTGSDYWRIQKLASFDHFSLITKGDEITTMPGWIWSQRGSLDTRMIVMSVMKSTDLCWNPSAQYVLLKTFNLVFVAGKPGFSANMRKIAAYVARFVRCIPLVSVLRVSTEVVLQR